MKVSSVQTQKLQPASPLFDSDAFLARLNDDLDQVIELVTLFLEIYPESLHNIADAVRRREPAVLRETAHRFQGSLKYMHANPAVAAAQRLEEMGRNGQLQAAREAFDHLVAEVELLCRELQAFLAAVDR